MRIIRECSQKEVLDHWRALYNYKTVFFRCDILEKLPNDLKWFEVEIQPDDLEKIFIISSGDWAEAGITVTFKVVEVVDYLKKGVSDDRIMPSILEKKRTYEDDINAIDRKFILVSPTLEGNYTILDGNKRAVALQSIDKLVGNVVYLGVSESIRKYVLAHYANRAR